MTHPTLRELGESLATLLRSKPLFALRAFNPYKSLTTTIEG